MNHELFFNALKSHWASSTVVNHLTPMVDELDRHARCMLAVDRALPLVREAAVAQCALWECPLSEVDGLLARARVYVIERVVARTPITRE